MVTALVVVVASVVALSSVVLPPTLPETVSVVPPASPSARDKTELFVPPDTVVPAAHNANAMARAVQQGHAGSRGIDAECAAVSRVRQGKQRRSIAHCQACPIICLNTRSRIGGSNCRPTRHADCCTVVRQTEVGVGTARVCAGRTRQGVRHTGDDVGRRRCLTNGVGRSACRANIVGQAIQTGITACTECPRHICSRAGELQWLPAPLPRVTLVPSLRYGPGTVEHATGVGRGQRGKRP